MAKAGLNLEHMKKEQVPIGTGADVEDTDVLDGAAKDSAVFDANNATVQYTTPAPPKGELGGQNNPNG
jgi:hypothetical protein